MENVLVRTSSSVGESNLHIQLTPAYRRDIFVNQQLAEFLKIYLEEKLAKMNIVLLATECGPITCIYFLLIGSIIQLNTLCSK